MPTIKDLRFGVDARDPLREGARKIAKAVGTTLGPKGRNVALSGKYSSGIIVHDGVTVAKEIKLEDPHEEQGAEILREAATKTNDSSGDGTTTATVLAYEMFEEGNKHIVAGANPMLMKDGMDQAAREVVKLLDEMAEPIKDNLQKMIEIATISSASPEIGKVIAEAIKKVGKYGVVTAEEGSELGCHAEYKDGMEWDKGYHLTYFAPDKFGNEDNSKKESIIKDALILVTDRTITSGREIVPFLNTFINSGKKNIVIISDGIDREALQILLNNFARGVINVLAVGAPSLGENKRDGLEDIAILTGATFISEEKGMKIETVKIEDLGHAEQVMATRDSTVISGGGGDKEKIKSRAKEIEQSMKDATHDYSREKFQERLAKLMAGVAVVKIGTASDIEQRDRIERVKDAIGATRAAVEEGIIPGGGTALLTVSGLLDVDKYKTREERLGASIIQEAIKKPIKLLVENGGANGEVVINEIKRRVTGMGYDVVTNQYVDMKKSGIIDPVKVTKEAVLNATSVAGMLLTTEVTATDIVKKEVQNGQPTN